MIEGLPTYISFLFGLTVIVGIVWFYWAKKSKKFLILALGWTVLQSMLGLTGIYQDTTSMPPRIMLLGVFPTLILIVITFLTAKGKAYIDSINLKTLTYFHSIRVLVEIVLVLLYHLGFVSVYMTFEGANFDLFSGMTASLIAYIAFRKDRTMRKLLLGWNIFCLLLLLNVVVISIFALPSLFQKVSLDQPNIAVLYFPFNLLPTVIVPMVLFGHLVAVRQLTKRYYTNELMLKY